MIPFLFMRGRALGAATVSFPGPLYDTTMGTSDTIFVNANYSNSGVFVNALKLYVRVGGVTTVWLDIPTGTVDSFATGQTFSSSSAGWVGAESYEIWMEVRRVSTGVYDVISNIITLTVS